jgi:hypothetical protein
MSQQQLLCLAQLGAGQVQVLELVVLPAGAPESMVEAREVLDDHLEPASQPLDVTRILKRAHGCSAVLPAELRSPKPACTSTVVVIDLHDLVAV